MVASGEIAADESVRTGVAVWLARPVMAAVGALAGLTVAALCTRPAPLAAMLLLGSGLAWRRPLVASLAVGLLAGWAAENPAPPSALRPVTLVGRLEGYWRPSPDGWLGELRVRHYRQGLRVVLWRQRVGLLLPGRAPPPAGRAVRVRGFLRRPAGLANRPPLAPGRWRLRVKSRWFLEARRSAGSLPRAAGVVRRRIELALTLAPPASGGGRLVRALVLGDAGALPAEWRRGLRAAGLAHLVALSGLHVGLLAALCLLAGAALPRRAGLLLTVAAAASYLLVAGARPALLRATAMAALAAAGLMLRRRPAGLAALAVAGAGMALVEPRLIADLGYRLTIAASAGILLLSPRLERRWQRLPGWLRKPLAVSAGAQVGSLPWTLDAFRLLVPLAPLWNLVAVPWTGLALAGCLAWAALAVAWPAAAATSVAALEPLSWPYAGVARLPPAVTAPLPLVAPTAAGAALAAAAALLLLRPRRFWPLAAVLAASLLFRGPSRDGPELRLFDVGQGEAALLRDGGRAVLVDGGGWRYGDLGGRVLMPALAAAGVRRLRAVVLSHPDLDHCQGLVDLLSYLPAAEVWTAPGWSDSSCARRLLTAPGIRLRVLWAGETVSAAGWSFEVLHPPPGDRGRGNDRSLVLAATAGGARVLLTGDLEAAGERRLLERWDVAVLRAGVLKVAHHGSRTSTTSALLAAVRPRLALISCGLGNRYGHPAPVVVERLRRAGARVLRTDLSGALVVRPAAGGRLRVETVAAPRPG